MNKKKNIKRNILSVAFLFVLLSMVLTVWFFNKTKPVKQVETNLSSVITVEPQRENIDETITVNGYLEPTQSVTILPKVSGQLMELYFSRGDFVQKGDVIAQVDPEPYELGLNQAEAAYLPAESTFKRISALYASGGVSLQNYEEAKAKYEAAKVQYESARLQLSNTRVMAPFSGTILETHRDPGNLVSPSVPLITLADLQSLNVRTHLPERYYGVFTSRREVINPSLRYYQDTESYPLDIENLSPYIKGNTGSFEVLCRIESPPDKFKPGLPVEITYPLMSYTGVYTVSRETLTQKSRIWLLDQETQTAKSLDASHFQPVEDKLILPQNLASRKIIIKGQHFLKEGEKVSVLSGIQG